MPRTKKNKEQTDGLQTVKDEFVSISDVQNRWQRFVDSSIYPTMANNVGIFSNESSFLNDPYLLNSRIKQLKSQPRFLERSKIEEALVHPESNEKLLREASHSMIYNTYPMYRLNMLYEGVLKYRDYVQPLYVDKEDMKKPRFLSDWKFIDMWVKKLNAKKQFRRIVGEVIPEGKRAYYLRQNFNQLTGKENVDYVHFQDLPSDYYKIIKHSTDQYEVVAFDFTYFWQPGTQLGQFPPIFAEYYNEMEKYSNIDKNGAKFIDIARAPKDVVIEYNSSMQKWFYWKELPSDECFVFSFTEQDDLQISPFQSLLLNAQDLASYSLLQQQLLTMPLYQIILGELPLHDDNKSGSHTDDLRLSPEVVGMFEAIVNSSMPPGTTFRMVPSEKNNMFKFQEVPNAGKIYNDGLQQMINTTGVSTLMTTTERPNVAQVNVGKTIEVRYIDRIYDQWQWAINIILGKMYDDGYLKYKWHYRIHGDAFSEKDKVAQLEKSLSVGQIEMLPEYLSYHDMSLMDAVTNADWVESSDIYKKFKPLINTFGVQANQPSAKEEKKNGRPRMEEDEVENEATANSMDTGQNTAENREKNE